MGCPRLSSSTGPVPVPSRLLVRSLTLTPSYFAHTTVDAVDEMCAASDRHVVEPPGERLDVGAIALAGRRLEADPVDDRELPADVPNEPGLLQRSGRDADAGATNAEHPR